MKMKDKDFLHWLADRVVYVYKESENVDFVQKLRNIADGVDPDKETPNLGRGGWNL